MGLWQRWVSRDGIDAGLSPGRGVWLQHRGGARLWLRAGTRQSGFTHSMMFYPQLLFPLPTPKAIRAANSPHSCLLGHLLQVNLAVPVHPPSDHSRDRGTRMAKMYTVQCTLSVVARQRAGVP